MIKIARNKYINALLVLMLFSAVIHMAVLFFSVAITGDFFILNYFNILDLDVLFPNLKFDTFWGNILSVAVAGLIYLLILKFDAGE